MRAAVAAGSARSANLHCGEDDGELESGIELLSFPSATEKPERGYSGVFGDFAGFFFAG
jgi:hypothetical protein